MTRNQGHSCHVEDGSCSTVLCFAAGRLAVVVGCVQAIVCSTGWTCKTELKFGGSRSCRSSYQILVALFSLVLLSSNFLKQILLALLNVGCLCLKTVGTQLSNSSVEIFSLLNSENGRETNRILSIGSLVHFASTLPVLKQRGMKRSA